MFQFRGKPVIVNAIRLKAPHVVGEGQKGEPGDWLVLSGTGTFTIVSDDDFRACWRPHTKSAAKYFEDLSVVVKEERPEAYVDQPEQAAAH